MDKFNLLIVEDNPSTAQNLEQQVKDIGYPSVKSVSNSSEALKFIDTQSVDAVIVNVFINGQPEGIQLADHFRKRNLPVLFVTANDDPEVYLKARKTLPIGYLVRPIKKVTLQSVIDNTLRMNVHKNNIAENVFLNNAFFVKQNNLLRKIAYESVLWIKTEGNYSIIYTKEKRFILKLSLKRVLDQLPTEYFIQTQRAYIVAISKIDDIDIGTSEVIINKERLPLGRNFKDLLLNRLKILK